MKTLTIILGILTGIIPQAKPLPQSEDTVRIMLIGDVMMHSRQLEYDHSFFLRDIATEMSQADICIANMEFTLAGEPYSGYPSFSAPDYYPRYAADCGTDVFLLANNHIMDKGAEGLTRTIEQYEAMKDSMGTEYTGVGGKPLYLRAAGLRLALINFTYGVNGRGDARVNTMERKAVKAMFDKAKEDGADCIIALPHWGEEYRLRHNATQQKWAEDMVEWGADVIVGAHPHVVQDTSHINGVPVIYSMGNAVSNMSATNTRLELAVTLTIVREEGKSRLLEPELDFLWCTLPGMLTESYSTISIKKWASRKGDWLTESDYINMCETLERVLNATGIGY